MPREPAQSSRAVVNAPDCDTKATEPGAAEVGAKLALSPQPGTSRPTQFGPRIRSRWGLAASSIARCRLRPPGPAAAVIPAVRTTAAFVPRAPRSAMSDGTVAAGV